MAIYHHHYSFFIKPFAPPITNNICLLFLLLLLLLHPQMSMSESEAQSLLRFKRSLQDPNHSLESWDVPGTEPCSPKGDSWWIGVLCSDGSVSGLRLESMKLSGKVDVEPLLNLNGLRTLSIQQNEFEGPIPAFNKLGVIKGMYVSNNKFSGKIPPDYFSNMSSMKKVWLSNNMFTGELPPSLTQLRNLIELHAENNQFTGKIPPLKQPPLVRLNLSNNKLEGEIPASLSKIDKSAFSGNDGVCGKEMGKKCVKTNESSLEGMTPITDNVFGGSDSKGKSEEKKNKGGESKVDKGGSEGSGSSNKVMIIVTVVVIGVLLLLVLFFVIRSRDDDDDDDEEEDDDSGDDKIKVVEVQVSNPVLKTSAATTAASASPSPARKSDASSSGRGSSVKSGGGVGPGGMGDLVMVSKEKGPFGLADLMRASAEVLGNGVLGSAYKATMASGLSVAVKRIKEMNRLGKDAFDAEIRKLAALKHDNILSPLAYHYRKEEKLVIYEYVKRGSLRYILHGDKGRPQPELTWPARWKIIQGIARGMDFLHTKLSSNDLPHGNLKSSNVFVTEENEALIAEYGFDPLINTNQVSTGLFAYKAPEAAEKQVGHKADVFTFGVMILEILTGKFPSQYLPSSKGGTDVVQWVASAIADNREVQLLDPEIADAKDHTEHMLRLLRVGAACTEPDPDMRPDMHEAARRVEETAR